MLRLFLLLATTALLGPAFSADAEPLGRLFFSPEERAVLDQMRQNSFRGDPTSTGQITLNGIVRRSSGKSTVWINRMPQNENEKPLGVAVLKPASKANAVPLLLPSGKKVNLKAGQTLDIAKGKVREGYEDAAAPLHQGAEN